MDNNSDKIHLDFGSDNVLPELIGSDIIEIFIKEYLIKYKDLKVSELRYTKSDYFNYLIFAKCYKSCNEIKFNLHIKENGIDFA